MQHRGFWPAPGNGATARIHLYHKVRSCAQRLMRARGPLLSQGSAELRGWCPCRLQAVESQKTQRCGSHCRRSNDSGQRRCDTGCDMHALLLVWSHGMGLAGVLHSSACMYTCSGRRPRAYVREMLRL